MFEASDNPVIGLYAQAYRQSKALDVTFWGLQLLLAATFMMAGATALSGAPMQVSTFEEIGLGQWFRYFTGGLEVYCAVLILIPRAAALGAALLAATMVGAIVTHLFITGGSAVPALALLLPAAAVAWYRGLYE